MAKVGRNDTCPCGSGTKYKRCCLLKEERSRNSAPKELILVADRTTLDMYAFVEKEGRSAFADAEPLFQKAVAEVIDEGTQALEIDGRAASETLTHLLQGLEKVLAEVCKKHTTLYWLMLLRRLFAADTYSGDFPMTATNIQATAELCAKKYGRPGLDDITAKGKTLPPANAKEPIFRDSDTQQSMFRKTKDWVINPPVDKQDFYDFIALCHLAAKYYYLTATYRRVGKGSKLVIKDRWEWDAEGSEELEGLISLYDQRLENAESDLLSSLGLSYVVSASELVSKTEEPRAFAMFGPQPRADEPEKPIPLLGNPAYAIPAGAMRYIPGFINLGHIERLMSFSRADFLMVHGLTWEAFVSFLTGITFHFLLSFRQSSRPLQFSTLLQRGYMLTSHSNLEYALGSLAEQLQKTYYPGATYTKADWGLYRARFLEMATVQPNGVDIHAMRPRSFIISCGERDLIDYSAIAGFVVEALRLRLSDDVKDTKAQVAEKVLEATLSGKTGLSPCYPRNKKFKDMSGVLGEADLSFRVGSVYIPVDIKAYLVTVEFDRGDYRAVDTRWRHVMDWVAQADRLGQTLKSKPKGTNYDLLTDGFTHVLPIVCSAFHEYVGSKDDNYFLTEIIPRVATPAEIASFLQSTDEESLKKHHCTVCLEAPLN